MDKFRKTTTSAGIDFYTNKAKGDAVKDTLKALMGTTEFMIARYGSFVRKDGYSRPYMHYALVTSTKLEPILNTDNQICEVLTDGKGFYRVFFDVEKEGKNVSDPLESVTEKISLLPPNADLNISGSHKTYDDGRVKYSYHIIVSNYHAECLDDFAPLKAFCLANKDLGFDECVYRQDGLLKCINQSKGDERVQQYISGSKEIMDHTVMHKTSSQSQSIVGLPTLLECLKDAVPKGKRKALKEQIKDPKTKKIKLTDVDIFPKMNLPTPPDLDVYQDEPLKLLKYLPNNVRYHEHQLSHSVCCRIARWCKYVGISWDDFWAWNKQKDDSTKREGKYRHYWNNMDLVKFPVSSKLVASYLITYVYDADILKTQPVRQVIASYNTKFHHLAETRHLSVEDHIKAEDSKAVIMHVPLSGAKSFSSMKWLERFIKNHPECTVLWATCRIALAKDQCGRIEKLTDCDKWEYYDKLSWKEKEDPNRPQEQYFVCSIQSIHRARGLYDVIVIDECETLLKSFDPENKCVPDMKRTWKLFQDQLNHAKKIILLDGFITQITTGMLADMGLTPYIAGSAMPPPLRQMVLCDTSCYIYDQIEKALQRGEKVFIGTGAKGKARPDREDSVEHIASTILNNHPAWKRGVEVLVYHGDTTQAKKDLERGAVNVMGNPKVRVVIGNAALSIGIDFSPTAEQLASGDITQFDHVFGIIQPSCISMRDFFQLLYRVRQPNSDTFIVYLAKPLSEGWKRNNGVKRELPDCNIYHKLVKRLEVELRAGNSLSYKQMFKKFCEWMNIHIIDGVETLTDEEKSAIEATFDYSQNMFAWRNIRDITEAEYDYYKDELSTSSMDAEIFLQMEKFAFKKLVPPDAQEVEWDTEKQLVYAIASLIRHEERLNNTWFKPLAQTRIIYNFYKTNNLKYGDAIPLNAICNTPFAEIKKAFGFHNAPTSYQTHLYSKLLNIFFESRILFKDYEKSSNGKRYAWVSDTGALGKIYEMIQTYKQEQMRQLLFGDGKDCDGDIETTLIMKAEKV